MDTKQNIINKETLIPLSVAGLVFLACIGCMLWMTTVFAKVSSAELKTTELQRKVDGIEKEQDDIQKQSTERYVELTKSLGRIEGMLQNKK